MATKGGDLSIEECKKQIADLQGKIEEKTGGGDDDNKDKDKLLADLAGQKKDILPAQVKLAQRRMLKGHFGMCVQRLTIQPRTQTVWCAPFSVLFR